MHVAVIITLCFSATLGAGLLLAGGTSMLSQDEEDRKRFEQKMEEVKHAGYLVRHRTMRREIMPLSELLRHWRTRPEGRRLIWIGAAFVVVVIIAAQFL